MQASQNVLLKIASASLSLLFEIAVAGAQTAPVNWMKARALELLVPTSASEHAIAYDVARQRVVLFGGTAADTWEWNGSPWRLRAPSVSPSGRGSHALAYDVMRQRVVLFGGWDPSGSAYLADTWEWDGATWTLRTPAANPPARSGHAMAYDAARQRVVLFGGQDATLTLLLDTWEWDGVTWTSRAPEASPSARAGHAMAYDVARHRIVLFGGSDGSGLLNDTWEWDGTSWSQQSPTASPGARNAHALAYDVATRRVVLFGGGQTGMYGRLPYSDTWEWDGRSWTQRTPATSPAEGDQAAMAYDVARQRIVLFAPVFNLSREVRETWEWNGTSWTLRDQMWSLARAGGSMAYDGARQRIVLFSGGHSSGPETWEWDGRSWTPRTPATRPFIRDARMAYDVARQRVVLCGWGSGFTYEWDGNDWTVVRTTVSVDRLNTAVAYDVARRRTVLFGGFDVIRGPQADTWLWDGNTWTLASPPTSPPARLRHAMAYDVARQRVVLFGGIGLNGPLTDTWEWDGTRWVQHVPAVQPAGSGVMAYDLVRQRVVLIGGASGSETWEWDGASWSQIMLATSPPRGGAEMAAYDVARQRVVLFGQGGTWLYGPLALATSQSLGTGCAGSNGSPLLTAEVPYLGNRSFSLDLLSARASAPCLLAISTNSDRQAIGGGCTLYLKAPLAALLTASNVFGFASAQLAIPNDPALRGQPFFAQGFVLDPRGPALGLAFSGGRALVLGD